MTPFVGLMRGQSVVKMLTSNANIFAMFRDMIYHWKHLLGSVSPHDFLVT
jgi:hypothetical protein